MFLEKRDKIILLSIIFIAFLGVSVGINYQKINNNDTLKIAKSCFEFGLYDFIFGKEYIVVFLRLLLSVIKHFIIFTLCKIFYFFIPIIYFNLFCINFKLGVFLSFVISTMKGNGIFEIFFTIIFCLFFSGVFEFYSAFLLSKEDKIFRKSFINLKTISLFIFALLLAVFIGCFILIVSDMIGLRLHGILKTFL